MNSQSKINFKSIIYGLVICAGILISYEAMYYLYNEILQSFILDLHSENKLDALLTLMILVTSTIFIFLNNKINVASKEDKILTFKEPNIKKYLLLVLVLFAMVGLSNISTLIYQSSSGDTETLEEIDTAISSDVDYYSTILDEYEGVSYQYEQDENPTEKEAAPQVSTNEDDSASINGNSHDLKDMDLTYQEAKAGYAKAYFWLFLAVVIIGPITEELIMRGICFKLIERKTGPTVAIIFSSITFGIFHGNITQGVYTSLLGLLLATTYYLTKDFFTVCILHILNNLLYTLPRMPIELEDKILDFTTYLGYIFIAPVLFIGIRLYINELKKTNKRFPI